MSDHFGQKKFLVGGFALITIANIMTGSSLNTHQKYLFFISRALSGLAVGALTSASISLLGQVYSPGLRKNRAFSLMASASPLGFWIGCMQGGALENHREWIFYSFSMLTAMAFGSSIYFVPKDAANSSAARNSSSIKHYDFAGAGLAILGSGCLVAGVTQVSQVLRLEFSLSLLLAIKADGHVLTYFLLSRFRELQVNGLPMPILWSSLES